MNKKKSTRLPKRYFDIWVFRVEEGLGNACLVRLPNGKFGVVDWGTQKYEPLEKLLRTIGNKTVEFIAATHAHEDHTLGIPYLIQSLHAQGVQLNWLFYPASSLYKPDNPLTKARLLVYRLNQARKGNQQTKMSQVSIDLTPDEKGQIQTPKCLAFGKGWEVRLLGPTDTTVGRGEVADLERDRTPGNETSMVMLMRFTSGVKESLKSQARALLPGDATISTLEDARKVSEYYSSLAMDNDFLLVQHHGSNKNIPHWFFKMIHGLVAISAPTNSLHHPDRLLLTNLKKRCKDEKQSKIYCTSFAMACSNNAQTRHKSPPNHIVRQGTCFGDMHFRIYEDGTSEFVDGNSRGELRREFGLC